MSTSLTIGILNSYHFDTTPGSYQEKYAPMILSYIQTVMPGAKIKTYLVAQNQFPNDVNECDSWIITGSPASCYDKSLWILKLIDFVQECHNQKIKTLGFCFGHQLLAHALGGEVRCSNKGWGIGIKKYQIIEHASWMKLKSTTCSMLFSHQDQVTKLPLGALHIAQDDFCTYQTYAIANHIFSFQGHPEFTKEYAKSRYDDRQEIIGESTYKIGIDSLKKDTDKELIDSWIADFLNS